MLNIETAKQIIENDYVLNIIKPFAQNLNVYIVGGYVRDALLGKNSVDRDLIVETGDVAAFSKQLADNLDAHFVPLDTINNIYRVVLNDKIGYLDITCPVDNNLEKDIARRDLTINSIAYDLNKKEFVDLYNGVDDLKAGKIKGISNSNFLDDPLRFLRVFRFESKLGFEVDGSLLELANTNAYLIKNIAKERISVELLKLFEGKNAAKALEKMDKTGLVEILFPIMKEVKTIPQNSHHHLDLFNHVLETTRQIEELYQIADSEIKNYLDSQVIGTTTQLGYLKFAAFCHDIGKPQTWTIDEDTGRHRFIKHDEIGSKLIVSVLKDLKLSKKQIFHIQKLIKYHIYPASIVTPDEPSEKSEMKFFRKMEGCVIDVIILAMADRLSARGPAITDEIINKNINGLKKLLKKYINLKDSIKPLPKLLDGNEIMKILNIKASKELGEIISKLKEAQLSGDITTKDEAVCFIERLNN